MEIRSFVAGAIVVVLFGFHAFGGLGAAGDATEDEKIAAKTLAILTPCLELVEKVANTNAEKERKALMECVRPHTTAKDLEGIPAGLLELEMDPLGSKNNIFGVVYKIRQRNKPEAPTLAMKVVPKGQDAKEFTIHKDLYDHEFPGADSKGVNHKFIPKIFGDKLTSSVGDMDFFVMEFFGLTAYNLADSTDVNVKMNVKETKLFLARSYLITLQVNSFNYVHNDGHGNNWAYSRTQPNVLFLFDFGRTRKLENGAMSFAVQDLSWWYENAKWFCAQHNRLADQEFYKEAAAALMKVWKTLNQMCGKNIDNVVVPLDSFRANSFDAYMKHALMVELNGYVKEWLETEGTNNINSQEDLSRWSTAEAAKNKKAAGATGTRRKRTGTEEPKIKPVSMEEADKFFKDVKRPESIDPKAKEPKLVRKPILVE